MRVTINENDCGCATCGNIDNSDICAECSWDSRWQPKPLTNGDRIRAMTDEELTTALLTLSDCADICQCDNCTWHTSPFCNANIFSENEICGWLKQPIKEET